MWFDATRKDRYMYGYKIENGLIAVNEDTANKIRTLYDLYLSGLSLTKSAKQAGITSYHGTAKRILSNHHYLGDSTYPAIVDKDTFDKAEEELLKRATKLGRLERVSKEKEIIIPTQFNVKPIKEHFNDPFKQAEYLYSLIESEVN